LYIQFASGGLEFDIEKSLRNARERGLPFERAADFDFGTAVVSDSRWPDYGAARRIAFGLIDGRLHALCFTVRGDRIRVISLRKANEREKKRYERERRSAAADG
jgi:uncharacterized DUF497 family protein